MTHNVEPNQPTQPAASAPNTNITLLIAAVIFFVLGFLVAGLLNVDLLNEANTENSRVAEGVVNTLLALTPPPSPTPTTVPVENSFSEGDYIRGNPNAPITLVEFSDYQCPWCGNFATETLPRLLAHYGDQLRFVYRDYPIFGAESTRAAHAAFCANRQDAFWAYHDQLFQQQAQGQSVTINDALLVDLAQAVGLNLNTFGGCLSDQSIAQTLLENITDAFETIGQQGTPFFLLNGEPIEGSLPFELFVDRIDAKLIELGIEPPA